MTYKLNPSREEVAPRHRTIWARFTNKRSHPGMYDQRVFRELKKLSQLTNVQHYPLVMLPDTKMLYFTASAMYQGRLIFIHRLAHQTNRRLNNPTKSTHLIRINFCRENNIPLLTLPYLMDQVEMWGKIELFLMFEARKGNKS